MLEIIGVTEINQVEVAIQKTEKGADPMQKTNRVEVKTMPNDFYRIGIIAFVSGLFFACNSPAIVEEYTSVDPTGWHADSAAVIEFEISDVGREVNMGIYVRNNAMYPFRNLYLFTELHAPDGKIARDTVNCVLADRSGKWLGSGMGSVKTSLHKYQLSAQLPTQGEYILKIFQGMRTDVLSGVEDVGLLIERVPGKS